MYHKDPMLVFIQNHKTRSNHWFIIYSQNKFFYIIAYLTFTLKLVTLTEMTLGQLQHRIDISYVCKYHQYQIISSCYIVETSYLQNSHLTLTLTLSQLQHLIDINHVCKYHQYGIIGSWYIVETSSLQNCMSDLNLWLCDLDLESTSKSY